MPMQRKAMLVQAAREEQLGLNAVQMDPYEN